MLLRAAAAGQHLYLLGPIVVGVAQVNPAFYAGVRMILLHRGGTHCPGKGGSDDVFAVHYRLARFLIGTAVREVLARTNLGGKVNAPVTALARGYGPYVAL